MVGPAQAQNLLANPNFDSSLAGWSRGGDAQGLTIWDNAGGSPSPGSAFLWNNDPNNSLIVTLEQCVPVVPGARYGLRAERFMANQGVPFFSGVTATFYDSGSCAGGSSGAINEQTSSDTSGNWVPIDRRMAKAPPTALRASVFVWLLKGQSGGALGGSFDHVFFGPPLKGDFDWFGSTDLVFKQLGTAGHHEVWLMNGVTRDTSRPITPDAPSAAWQLVGTDDFNGDLIQDLVFWNNQSGQVQFWHMDASGTNRAGAAVSLSGSGPLATSWRVAATGDFNHDGQPDMLWRNVQSQQLVVWLMNGTATIGSLTPNPAQAVDANWSVVAALDWNGDSNTDLLWYNSTSGKIVLWFMDASVARITGQFTNPPNAGNNNWKVVAAGDYGVGAGGQAGTNDIVWRNDSSGNLVVWYMDKAGNRTSGVFASPSAPTDPLGWSVVGPK